MKKVIQGLFFAAALLPAAASAENLSYSFVEGGLALYPDFDSQSFIGLDARGSVDIKNNIFAFGGLKYLTDDVDLTALHIGGGYRHSLDISTDLWGGVTIEHQDLDIDSCRFCDSVDDTALGLRGGLRHQVDEKLEVGGGARIITGDLDYIGLTGTARYAVQRDFKLFGEVDLYDGELGLIGGVTLEF